MNSYKSKSKILATIVAILLFASMMTIVIPQANAAPTIGEVRKAGVGVISSNTAGAYEVTPGDTLYIQVMGVTVGARVKAYWQNSEGAEIGTALLSGSATSTNVTVTVPDNVAYGDNYAIIIRDEALSNLGQIALNINIRPKLTATPSSGLPGDQITLTGSGFHGNTAANRVVHIQIPFVNTDGNSIPVSFDVTANTAGSFTTTFTVPANTKYDSYNISATDGASASVLVTFGVGRVLTLTPSSGQVGAVFTLSGRGFTPGETIDTYTITIDSGSLKNMTGVVTVNSAGMFTASVMIKSGPSGDRKVIVQPSISGSIQSTFRITPTGTNSAASQPSLKTDKPAGQPTTNAGAGDTITVTGTNFAHISGTTVTLYLQNKTDPLAPKQPIGTTTTDNTGTFSHVFTIPGINTGIYNVLAEDDYGITGTCDLGVTILYVGIYDNNNLPIAYDLSTGMKILIKGTGFDIFGQSYIANVTVNGQLLPDGQNRPHTAVRDGVSAVIGVDGSTLSAGTYVVTITTNEGLTASTRITVTNVAKITVTPKTAPRDSAINIIGEYFSGPASVTIQVRNASTNTLIDTIATTTNATGFFNVTSNKASIVSANFALGDYIINATDSNRVTAATTLTVAKVNVTIAFGARSYVQGEIGTIQLSSNTAPTGIINVYDSIGALVTKIDLTANNWVPDGSGGYFYQQSKDGGVPAGALLQIASDARTGTWTWNSTINDANEPQNYNGNFTVVAKNTVSPSATPSATPSVTVAPTESPSVTVAPTESPSVTVAPTATPNSPTPPDEIDNNGNLVRNVIIVVVVIALIAAVIGIFMYVRMRRKIAN